MVGEFGENGADQTRKLNTKGTKNTKEDGSPNPSDTMKRVLKSQYLAALEMLRRAIRRCPETLWDDPAFKNRFWRVAYHTLFYADLYLSRSEKEFKPWEKHRDEVNFLGAIPWKPKGRAKKFAPYSRKEVLEYLQRVAESVEARVESVDLNEPSGFSWLRFSKLELQIYNIRHIQHHAAQLIERVRQGTGKGVEWVGKK